MKLYNNTPNEAYYGISDGTGGDCGTIAAGGTADWPAYDNEAVQVRFTAVPPQSPFSITIPSTGTGMTVTIGLYQE